MILKKYFAIWREFQGDKKNYLLLFIILVMVVMSDITFCINSNIYSDLFVFFLNSIYGINFIKTGFSLFKDKNNTIETLLSIPKNIEDILIGKTIYVLSLSTFFSILNLIIVYVLNYFNILNIQMGLNINDVYIIVVGMIASASLIYFSNQLIWFIRLKNKWILFAVIILVYNLLQLLLKLEYIYILILFIIISIIFFSSSIFLKSKISKETIVERSL